VVRIDEAVDYGSSLTGFMRDVVDAHHVLLVVDENYVVRADTMPTSGVGIETKWISGAYSTKPENWLSVLWVGNPGYSLPGWMGGIDPKGFDFNAIPADGNFPGASQLNELWRWIEGLPPSSGCSISPAELRRRSARLERVDVMRDPGQYASPSLRGRTTFRHGDHAGYTIGHDEYKFVFQFSSRSPDSVYMRTDGGLEALGLVTTRDFDPATLDTFLRPGRLVQPKVGQKVVALNRHGVLCLITIEEIQHEMSVGPYTPGHVTFSWDVLAPGTTGDS